MWALSLSRIGKPVKKFALPACDGHRERGVGDQVKIALAAALPRVINGAAAGIPLGLSRICAASPFRRLSSVVEQLICNQWRLR